MGDWGGGGGWWGIEALLGVHFVKKEHIDQQTLLHTRCVGHD